MIRIVAVGDGDMSQIVEIAVVGLVGAEDGCLYHVAEDVDAVELVQLGNTALGVAYLARVDGIHDTITVALQISNGDPHVVRLTVNVRKDNTHWASWKGTSSHRLVELREVRLWHGLAQVRQAAHLWQAIAETLGVVTMRKMQR